MSCRYFVSLIKSLVEDIVFSWLFSYIFTLTWLLCIAPTTHGSFYFCNLINRIPDWLRWETRITLISDWRCSCFTSHPVFIVVHFWKYAVFQYIFNVFKNVNLVNHHKPRVTCIFHIKKYIFLTLDVTTLCIHIFSFDVPCDWRIPTLAFHLRPNNLRHCRVFPNYEMCRIWESAYTVEKGKMYCVRVLQFWRKNIQKFKIT